MSDATHTKRSENMANDSIMITAYIENPNGTAAALLQVSRDATARLATYTMDGELVKQTELTWASLADTPCDPASVRDHLMATGWTKVIG